MQPQAKQNGKKEFSLKVAARCLVVFAMAGACAQAMAQYVWLDEKGVRQYSDQPPPPSVPNSRILRGKGMPAAPAPGAPEAAAANGAVNPASNSTTPAKTATPSIAERNAEFNKRRAQRAADEKKAADQQKLAEQKKLNCERAASYKRSLENGMRVARTNANGEQVILNDEQRAQELQEANRMLESCTG